MIGCDCPVCTSSDPRDRHLRSSALVEYGGLTILVDAGPDFRYQMLRAGVRHLDAIVLTHNHKDHTGGLDDIRAFNLIEGHPVNIFCEQYVCDTLKGEYPYAFAENKYPGSPEWRVHIIDSSAPFRVHTNAIEEILRWENEMKNPGLTVVPVALFIDENNLAKVEVALARGKKLYDKRQSLKEKDDRREMERSFKRY